MNIAFRVDSSDFIGVGHLRRCLKLADDLKKRNKKIYFITKNSNGNFNTLIKKKKFKIIILKKNKKKNKILQDVNSTIFFCKKLNIETLIVDHYYLNISWEKKIKKHIKKLVIIDDFSKNKHYCDLIINNLSSKILKKTKNLTGLKYVITPDVYSNKKNKKKKNKQVTIGTFFGSTDRENCSERLLKIFTKREFCNFKFISILGQNNKNKIKIEKSFKNYKNFYVEKNFIKMKNFFKKIDILITVGGMTSFEAMLNEVKCIYIPINYYQKATCEYLKKKNNSKILSFDKVFNKHGKTILINCIKKVYKEKNYLKSKDNFDHLGSERIAKYISSNKFN